ncbi:helix-turn-helix transcriptional regulator [Runella sp.]|uniref:AraC family transcriptional regulator n=1 Tax=Runella sp. TaxID=1960881 RepID=UPI00260175C8|nr:helix-turn-helix transcriptional regulator [Runella sp.]
MKNIPIYGITEFSETDLVTAFYANNLRSHLQSHRFVNSAHKHSTYIAVLFTEGSGKHEIDFDTYEVRPGSVFLLTPGQVHSWELSADINGYVFFHTESFYNTAYLSKKLTDFPFFYLQTNYPVIYLQEDALDSVIPLFKAIYEEYQTHLPFKFQKLNSLIDLTYIQLSRSYQEHNKVVDKQPFQYNRIKKLEKLIDENFKTKKLPKEYADLMNMTTRHLNRICQETLNQTTTDLILKRVMVEAQRMLIHNDVTVAAVADSLGYEDYSYFIRLFKKQIGESPKKFQNRMTNSAIVNSKNDLLF